MATATITVVFTDLVGSTELLSRVGEARADELRREHFGLLRGAVTGHGGREVKNLGDGLMVVFDGVSSALDAAVAMQQAITARPAESEPLSIKVGVAVGDAELEDGDYFGLPVVEAARLCAKAQGGEILTTEFVRMLAKSRSDVELESVGALELKGLDEPVESYRVPWAPAEVRDERPLLPARLAVSVSANFVGRAAEVEQLTDAWKAIGAEGERRVLLVSGEPGIGKTTLSARFACSVYEEGGAVVYGRCDEDLGIPYQPWIEALTQVVREVPLEVLAAHVADRGGHLARVVPELARRVPVETSAAGDADTERFVLFGCVVDLLARVSGEYPLLVVLDDLHWADRGSVQLLRHVAASDDAMRVGILGTFRDSDITTDHPLADFLAALHRENRGVRIALRGFDDDDLLHLLETIAGHEMDEHGVALRDALLAETAGNPFFVAEILRHLAETGAIYPQADGRWAADPDLRAVGLPVSVREVVGRRLAGLGADTERVLGLGSVIGRDFDIALLAAVAQTDEDTLIDLCDAAVEAAVLQATDDPDRYTFAHALIEHTLYDGLSLARRVRAHKAVAEHLETLAGPDGGSRVGELAYHWAQAVQPADTAKAVHYAQVAGDRALDQLAPDDALRWYAQALELLDRTAEPDRRQRVEILIGLGDAERQTGVAAYRETLLDAAQLADEIDQVELLVRAVLTNNRGIMSLIGDVDHERIAVLEKALARVDDPSSPDRARLLALLALEKIYDGDLDERLALADEAVATGRRSGDPAALVDAMRLAVEAIRTLSTLDQRRAWSFEASELADALGALTPRYWTHNVVMLHSLEAGDIETFRTNLAISGDIAARVPHATVRWNTTFLSFNDFILRGDLIEAERIAELAREMGDATGQPDTFSVYGAQLLCVRLHQGRGGEVLPLLEQLVSDQPRQPVFRTVLAYGHAVSGDRERAATLIGDARTTGFELPRDLSWSIGIALWAEAAVRIRDTESGRVIRDVLAPCPDAIVTSTATILPSVSHSLGRLDHLLGDLDSADRHFTAAAAMHERMESPLLSAYTDAARAELLADRGNGDDDHHARTLAERALAASTAGGYGYIERDARAVLEQLA